MRTKIYLICSVLITIGFSACAFLFPLAFLRLWDSIKDIGFSVAYYFCEIFSVQHQITPTVNEIPSALKNINLPFLPQDFDLFCIKIRIYFHSLWSQESLLFYCMRISNFLESFSKMVLLLLPAGILFVLWYRSYFKDSGQPLNSFSRPLQIYLFIRKRLLTPIIQFLKNLFHYARTHHFFTIWIILWAFYFNFFMILIEFVAYYFYLVVSFDLMHIYRQIYKMFLDLLPMMIFIPTFLWILIGIWIFDFIRRKIGYERLHHLEMRNRGFINSTGQVTLICGEPGTGKTTSLTDMCLSLSVMFRNKAFEKILENDIKFPNFTYAVLESQLRTAIEYHQVYNLSTAEKWIRKKKKKFYAYPTKHRCFEYDYQRYGLIYWDGLKQITLFEMLENYVKLYFIYVMESSLIVSNYGIREDHIINDQGNFPLWHFDFFRTDQEYMNAYSRHAHILDFDMLRLGKTVIENNKKRNAFEFGIVAITEAGKERGNSLENQEIKKSADKANRKNDLFSQTLKMIRHSATVDNFPFVKILLDEQRAQSLDANDRELCEKVLFIREKKETKNLLWMFSVEEMIHDWIYGKFQDLYYRYRYQRCDNTLLFYLIKNAVSSYHHFYMRRYNTFGYNIQIVETDKGTLDASKERNKYYLLHKKIYSKRFATDAFSDYFRVKTAKSKLGINDIAEFETERATLEELESENSYFIFDIMQKK